MSYIIINLHNLCLLSPKQSALLFGSTLRSFYHLECHSLGVRTMECNLTVDMIVTWDINTDECSGDDRHEVS